MVLTLESEKAAQFLRFQNVKEEKVEDLPDTMADLMAKALGIGKDEMTDKFLYIPDQAEMVLSAVQKSLPAGQQKHYSTENQEVNKLLLEKEALQQCLAQQEKQYSIRINNLKSELSKNKKDMDALKLYLNKLLKEKDGLKVHKFKVEESIQFSDTADTTSLQITDFEDHHQLLIDENASMKKHLQNFNKMREMTEMLQENHRILISTNEHLLKQLNEMHLKHKAEVEQLHCNYDQLKKTMNNLSPKLNNDN
ncbi:PREDICTED: centrosomal protein of 72 kDa-like [Thamnophis sirtalis]|uniref:Centrosomal protein of 72 kDa-like n=1 Tax=Thamnophis sirtalis TaxID=35019 RepID=A0A6I9X1U3_9SAUR|nr:PREDICTED: centrosomal protein of 72 kDa-like [Thamnophis sirtalis]